MRFQCPYCFEWMEDDEVHFRSDKVNTGDNNSLPEDYDDIEDFKARYNGNPQIREKFLQNYREYEFFRPVEDHKYTEFWKKCGGTTERDFQSGQLQFNAYERRVLIPQGPDENDEDYEYYKEDHRRYIRLQDDGSYFIRDHDGMVAQIELKTGEICRQRVCKHCHNPLPDNYGKYPVKFTTLIGITNSGKTVYLSQLLRSMSNYCVRVGLSALTRSASVRAFVEANRVEAGVGLPVPTPAGKLEQPLFFELIRTDGKKETLVLYDIAGELFQNVADDNAIHILDNITKFVKNANGLIILIDPMQIDAVASIALEGRNLRDAVTALHVIHDIISETEDGSKTPVAICISKADMEDLKKVMGEDLINMLVDDVDGIRDDEGFFKPIFNANQYLPIGNNLREFMINNANVLATYVRTNYKNYAYFAFTALGCDVEKRELLQENGTPLIVDGKPVEESVPIGPILPRRIEEPLYWLFHQYGYIGTNEAAPEAEAEPDRSLKRRGFIHRIFE